MQKTAFANVSDRLPAGWLKSMTNEQQQEVLTLAQYRVLLAFDKKNAKKEREGYDLVYQFDPDLIDTYFDGSFMGTLEELVDCVNLRLALKGCESLEYDNVIGLRKEMLSIVRHSRRGWNGARKALVNMCHIKSEF